MAVSDTSPYSGHISPWDTVDSSMVQDCRVFSVHRHRRRNTRREGTFYVLQGADWCNIIPLTADDEVVMIEQFRHGTRDVTLEIPGGIVDASDTTPAEAARRELREETGWDGTEIEPLGTIAPNPAIQSNHCHSFLVRDARPVTEQRPDDEEEIHVRLVPLCEVPDLILRGVIDHALVVVAFSYLFLQRPELLKSTHVQ